MQRPIPGRIERLPKLPVGFLVQANYHRFGGRAVAAANMQQVIAGARQPGSQPELVEQKAAGGGEQDADDRRRVRSI